MNEELSRNDFVQLAVRSFLTNAADLIFVKDVNLRYVASSLTFARMVGCNNMQELVGKTDYDIFAPELARKYTEDDRKVLQNGVSIVDYIEPLPDKDGKKSYSSTSKHVIRDQQGDIIGIYGVGRDVTAQVELAEERERRELSRQMFEDVLEADVTENRMLNTEGSAWARALGLTDGSAFSDTVQTLAERFIHLDYKEDFKRYYQIDKLVGEYEKGIEEFSHITYQSDDGKSYRWTEFRSKLYYSRVSGTLRIATFLKDFDYEIKMRERLRRRAEVDALTGLLNRESTMEQIAQCIAQEEDMGFALLLIDLDCFKQVNDTHGHPFGDQVLQSIAKKMQTVFSNDDLMGRIGGDEFLVLLKNVSSQAEADQRARRIFSLVPLYRCEGEDLCVTCSVGVSLYTQGKTLEELYTQADIAMYQAKKAGKNTMVFYEP